jgi:hypothetical protein
VRSDAMTGKTGRWKARIFSSSHLTSSTHKEEGSTEYGLENGIQITVVIQGPAKSNSFANSNDIHRVIDKRENVEDFVAAQAIRVPVMKLFPSAAVIKLVRIDSRSSSEPSAVI